MKRTKFPKPEETVICANCHKAIPKSKVLMERISNYRQYGPGGRMFPFCSGSCAVEYQMGVEG